MSALAITKVDRENFAAFVHLIEKLAEYEHLTPPDSAAKDRLMTDALGKNPKCEAYLATLDGKTTGYVTFYFTYSTFLARPTLYLEDIFVLKEYRRQGVGERLLAFCRSEAYTRGCWRMEWMVLDWNEPAIRFYEKSGAGRLGWYVYRLNRDQLLPPGR